MTAEPLPYSGEPPAPGVEKPMLTVVSDDRSRHLQEIARKITEYSEYGPVCLRTYQTSISDQPLPRGRGIDFLEPPETDPSARRQAWIGSRALNIMAARGGLSVGVRGVAGSLDLSMIHHVGIDHPLGNWMPLHGRNMPRLTITNQGLAPVLACKDNMPEKGERSVVASAVHPDEPGIGVVRTFDIKPGDPSDMTPEEASELGRRAMTFLISTAYPLASDRTHTLITSCMGRHELTPSVVVRPPVNASVPNLHVEMMDFPGGTTTSGLMNMHRKRLANFRAAYTDTSVLPQLKRIDVDEAFLYGSFTPAPIFTS